MDLNMKYENAGSRFPYSVADTESGPEFHWINVRKLRLLFTDSKSERIDIVFHNVLGLKYQNAAFDQSGWAEDAAIEVIGSDWRNATCQLAGEDPHDYRHLIIGFNERGMILDVLFSTISDNSQQGGPSEHAT